MILEFAVWRAVPRAGKPEGKRSLCDGCYAVELNLQIPPILVFRHQNCVRAPVRAETQAWEPDDGAKAEKLIRNLAQRMERDAAWRLKKHLRGIG